MYYGITKGGCDHCGQHGLDTHEFGPEDVGPVLGFCEACTQKEPALKGMRKHLVKSRLLNYHWVLTYWCHGDAKGWPSGGQSFLTWKAADAFAQSHAHEWIRWTIERERLIEPVRG